MMMMTLMILHRDDFFLCFYGFVILVQYLFGLGIIVLKSVAPTRALGSYFGRGKWDLEEKGKGQTGTAMCVVVRYKAKSMVLCMGIWHGVSGETARARCDHGVTFGGLCSSDELLAMPN